MRENVIIVTITLRVIFICLYKVKGRLLHMQTGLIKSFYLESFVLVSSRRCNNYHSLAVLHQLLSLCLQTPDSYLYVSMYICVCIKCVYICVCMCVYICRSRKYLNLFIAPAFSLPFLYQYVSFTHVYFTLMRRVIVMTMSTQRLVHVLLYAIGTEKILLDLMEIYEKSCRHVSSALHAW